MNKNFSIQGLQDIYSELTGNKNSKFREPTSVTFKSANITKQDRTMDGTLLVDYIATKKTVSVSWNMLDDSEFKSLEKLLASKRESNRFFEIEFFEDGGSGNQNILAYTDGIDFYPYFLASGEVVWRDVKIEFAEV